MFKFLAKMTRFKAKKKKHSWDSWIHSCGVIQYEENEKVLKFKTLTDLALFISTNRLNWQGALEYENGVYKLPAGEIYLYNVGVMDLTSPYKTIGYDTRTIMSYICKCVAHTGINNIVMNKSNNLSIAPDMRWDGTNRRLMFFYDGKFRAVEDTENYLGHLCLFLEKVCKRNSGGREDSEDEKISAAKVARLLDKERR